jgi:hypothetical protein
MFYIVQQLSGTKPKVTTMAKANKTAKPATTAKVTVAPVPAPKATAPVAPVAPGFTTQANTVPHGAWAGFKHPVTQAQVQHFINSQCGGNPALCAVQPLPNMVQGAPVPFLRKATGARAAIINALLWGFANGHTGPVNVGGAYQHFKAKQYGTQGYLDLVALLNGGFTASSKTWGQPVATLVAVQPAAPAK